MTRFPVPALLACLTLAPLAAAAQSGCEGSRCSAQAPRAVIATPAPGFVDEAPLSSSDRLSRELGFGISGAALGFQTPGPWLGSFVTAGGIAADISQGADYALRGAVVGYGFDWMGLSPFIGYGQGKSGLDDGVTEARIRSYFIGLGLSGEAGHLSYGAAIYAGRSHNAISDPVSVTGDADFDGRILGISLRGDTLLWQSATGDQALDLRVRGDYLQHSAKRHDVSGLLGGSIDQRTATSTALRIELGAPMASGGLAIRPYLGFSTFGGTQDAFVLSLPGTGTSFAAADVLHGKALSIGTDFAAGGKGLKGRVDLSRDDAAQTAWTVNLGVAF